MGLDLALAGFLLITAIRGWFKGFALQAVRLGGTIGSVYLADPVRNLAKPHVASHLPSIRPDLVDRILWWGAAVLSFVVLVGVGTLVVKLTRRNPIGEFEPRHNDQVGGMLFGLAKGVIIAAFLVAGFQKYALGYLKSVPWFEEQARSSKALAWNETYQPGARIWASPPVRHFVAHVERMGLTGPGEKPAPEAVQTASNRPPRLTLPSASDSVIEASGLDPEIREAVKAIPKELKALARPK